jgi:hypothetical protein
VRRRACRWRHRHGRWAGNRTVGGITNVSGTKDYVGGDTDMGETVSGITNVSAQISMSVGTPTWVNWGDRVGAESVLLK